MLFLIEYDRSISRTLTFREFSGTERRQASEARLELELALNRQGIEHEVVLLEAVTKQALYKTHRRYFENLETYARSA